MKGSNRLVGALSIALWVSGCTLQPCLLDECERERRDVSGNFGNDLLGQWQVRRGSGPTYMYRFSSGGAFEQVVLCDHGEYVQPGERVEGSYSLDENQLTISTFSDSEPDGPSQPSYIIEQIGEDVLSATYPVKQPDGEFEWRSVAFERVSCEL